MRSLTRRLTATALMIAGALAAPALAQSPFSAAVEINDRAITYYEIDQRVLFFEVLNAPGNLRERAVETLVNERLQVDAAIRQGIELDPADLQAGLDEFAGRANLSPDELIQALGGVGIDAETLRDFVRNGLLWRNLVRARFGDRVDITEDDIDRALALSTGQGEVQVVLAEIFLALTPQNEAQQRALANQLSAQLDGDIGGFSAAARQYSAAQTGRNGGVLPARALSTIPPGLRALILPLSPGGTTDPVPLGGALAIFQLRSLTETDYTGPVVSELDYATVPFAGGRTADNLAAAADLSAEADTCDDLYGVLPGGFERVTQPVEEVPADISNQLMRLDANEVSTELVRPATGGGEAMIWIMLCERTIDVPEGAREQVQAALRQQILVSYADGYLEELRADAIITYADGL